MQLLSDRRRVMQTEEPFKGFLIEGQFTDDSTQEDWWFRNGAGVRTIITDVNPITKTFRYNGAPPGSIHYLFHQNTALKRIDKIEASNNYRGMNHMFYACPTLEYADLTELSTDGCTAINGLFYQCYGLKSFKLGGKFTLKDCQNFSVMFLGCTDIEYIDLSSINTQNGTNFSEVFSGCLNLKELYFDNDFSKGMDWRSAFYRCTNLTTVRGSIRGLQLNPLIDNNSIDLRFSSLTNESAMVFINGLAEVETPQIIRFRGTTYNSLTPEQIKIATDKGWIVEWANS